MGAGGCCASPCMPTSLSLKEPWPNRSAIPFVRSAYNTASTRCSCLLVAAAKLSRFKPGILDVAGLPKTHLLRPTSILQTDLVGYDVPSPLVDQHRKSSHPRARFVRLPAKPAIHQISEHGRGSQERPLFESTVRICRSSKLAMSSASELTQLGYAVPPHSLSSAHPRHTAFRRHASRRRDSPERQPSRT